VVTQPASVYPIFPLDPSKFANAFRLDGRWRS